MNKITEKGFTLLELLVSVAIIAIIFSFVLANFRTAQYSGETDIVLKQVVSGINTARNMSLGGQIMTNQSFPDKGYGISLESDQFLLIAVFPAFNEQLPDSLKRFNDIDLDFCSYEIPLPPPPPLPLPCSPDWDDVSGTLEIIFSLPDQVYSNITGVDYVGGIITNQKTGQRAYFYVSLISGLVTGGLL